MFPSIVCISIYAAYKASNPPPNSKTNYRRNCDLIGHQIEGYTPNELAVAATPRAHDTQYFSHNFPPQYPSITGLQFFP